jgi:hypothetical protein
LNALISLMVLAVGTLAQGGPGADAGDSVVENAAEDAAKVTAKDTAENLRDNERLSDIPEALAVDSPGNWKAGIVPKISLNSDDGLGLGVRGTLFWHRFNQRPYKTAIHFQTFLTTRLVQHHYLGVDALRAFNLPFRITAMAGAYISQSRNHCGIGNTVTCDPILARVDGQARGLDGDALEEHVRTYYLLRTMEPYLQGLMRYTVAPAPHKVELFGGWRGVAYIPGAMTDNDENGEFDLGPFPRSLYAQTHPEGEAGFLSQPQVGMAVDNRDHELDPTRGYFVEASVRGAQSMWGSTWDFGGGNITLLGFWPLVPDRVLTLASRTIFDGMWGDPPFLELARTGGISSAIAFGGMDVGRGLRAQRLVGRIKLMQQVEARGWFWKTRLWEQDFDFGWALFGDAGHVRSGVDSNGASATQGVPDDPWRVHLGGGASLRFAWNENFIMRLDLALSPDEPGRLGVYSGPNHPF